MKKSKIARVIWYTFVFLLGMLIASYYPLPGVYVTNNRVECPELNECPVGFATLEEMSFLVEELNICKERKCNEGR